MKLEAIISRMTMTHIDGVMTVENLSFGIPWSREAFVEELTNNKAAIYLTAMADGMVVGYAGLWKILDEGHITNIAVHPQYRSTGIGSLLLERLISVAREAGIVALTLEVRRSNLMAQALYQKYGFTVAGARKRYYADNNEDALIMWKHEI